VKGILILQGVEQRLKTMMEITYVVIGRDTNELKTRVRFRLGFIQIGGWSCQSTKPWPNVQAADDVIPSNEYTLVLG
jgi:hypothetical protein